MTQQHTISLPEAQDAVAAGFAKAEAIGQPKPTAVLDAGGNLLTSARMDKAWRGSIDIATQGPAPLAHPNARCHGIHASNGNRMMIFAGGVPLKSGGVVIGGGISGGTAEQDQTVVEAATR